MKLIEILEKRISDNHYDKAVVEWLHHTATIIITKTSAHLEYVRNVLDEFDKHNAEHSEKVLQIMENLLGDHAEQLSSYDIFSLIAVAYLHDCGMAVSDYEVNVMKLVENGEFDGKEVCKKADARTIIKKNKNVIFKTDRDAGDIEEWLFYPGNEHKLFDYYAQLLIDYQTFRNGKKDTLQNSKDLNQTNKELRVDFIRRTHTNRIQTYIETWGEKEIANLNGNKTQGENLFNNIAMACKAHGEDENCIKELDINAGYMGIETSNLQFVAMMLRIGDIVHFTHDRAPVVLRALHHFESDYSYEQWRIKTDTGVNFPIKDGTINCNAKCKNPKDYYNLSTYIDFIDYELSLYNRLKHEKSWDDCYPEVCKSVNRNNLKYDKKLFTPVPHLKFTLEQNKILDLLMGAKLYSDEYACLRELYQNSLDACRCQIAIDKSKGKESKGKIEFGLENDEDGNKYVYCLDNGKGMSKHIIENYLLKIGSSYYKSSEFYQSQANTGNTFTPTSQFGIGILSCFMIGDRIEITTREENGKDGYISCVMENIHECFYYKNTPSNDTDLIKSSGTLIKIFLNEKYKEKLSNKYFENIEFLLWNMQISSDHLYYILDDFVKIVPKEIELSVRMDDCKIPQKIYNKPITMGEKVLMLSDNNIDYNTLWNTLQKKVSNHDLSYYSPKTEKDLFDKHCKKALTEIKKSTLINLNVEFDGIQCRKNLVFPKEGDDIIYALKCAFLLYGQYSCCVDGIKVDNSFVTGYYLRKLDNCIINFVGPKKPQLSISRDRIVNYDIDRYEKKIRVLLGELIKQAINKIVSYIKEHHIKSKSQLYYKIWDAFFEQFKKIEPDMMAPFFYESPIKDLLMPLPIGVTTSRMTFGEFVGENVSFENYHHVSSEESNLIYSLINYRIRSSKNALLDGVYNISIKGYQPNKNNTNYIPATGGLFENYDFVNHLFPLISNSLYIKDEDKDFRISDSLKNDFINNILGILSDDTPEKMINDFIRNQDRLLHERLKELSNNNETNDDKIKISTICSLFINEFRQLLIAMYHEESKDINFLNPIVATIYISYSFSKEHEKVSPWLKVLDSQTFAKDNVVELSIIIFGKDTFYATPGCWSRQELVNKVPKEIWNDLQDKEYQFTDGTIVKRV